MFQYDRLWGSKYEKSCWAASALYRNWEWLFPTLESKILDENCPWPANLFFSFPAHVCVSHLKSLLFCWSSCWYFGAVICRTHWRVIGTWAELVHLSLLLMWHSASDRRALSTGTTMSSVSIDSMLWILWEDINLTMRWTRESVTLLFRYVFHVYLFYYCDDTSDRLNDNHAMPLKRLHALSFASLHNPDICSAIAPVTWVDAVRWRANWIQASCLYPAE